jgi:DnaJ family protein A protein 2
MVTQETVTCDTCKGSGKVYKEKDRCKRCKGERVTVEKKALEIYIPPGSK